MRRRRVHVIRLVAASLIASVLATANRAQADSASEVSASGAGGPAETLLNDRFVLALGGYVVNSATTGSLSGSANAAGKSIDFARQFGIDAYQTRFRAEALWRITPRQHLRFSYWDNNNRHTRTIDQDLAWGDYTFVAGGQVTAQVKYRVAQLDYEFALLRQPHYEIVAAAGVHFDDLTLKLSGNASLTVDTPAGPIVHPATFTTKSSSVPAPLPVVGLRADWAVSPHIYLDATGQVFAASYQGINGNWSDLRAGATWMFSDHFGLGIGYDRFANHVDLNKSHFNGRLNFSYQGLLLYLKGGF